MAPRLFGSLAVVLLTACSSPVGERLDVHLLPAQETFSPGAPATVTLVNRSDVRIGYGACDPQLEQRTAAGWVPVQSQERPCIGVLYVLDAGASAEIETRIESELKAGAYRFRMRILPETTLPERHIHSPPFEVRP